MNSNMAAAAAIATEDQLKIDHRTMRRGDRTKYDHAGALSNIQRDCLASEGPFNGTFEIWGKAAQKLG